MSRLRCHGSENNASSWGKSSVSVHLHQRQRSRARSDQKAGHIARIPINAGEHAGSSPLEVYRLMIYWELPGRGRESITRRGGGEQGRPGGMCGETGLGYGSYVYYPVDLGFCHEAGDINAQRDGY